MEEKQKEVTRAETTGSMALWFGVLAGPLVWAVQLLLNFGLPEAVACAPGSRRSGVLWGLGVQTVIQITNVVATGVTLLALLVSYRLYRRLLIADPTHANRARWMATAGIFNSALFLILTALKFASPLSLGPCGPSP